MARSENAELNDLDPFVRDYLARTDWHFVSRGLLTRAALILQALIEQARDRGFKVTRPSAPIHNAHTRGKHDRTPFWIESAVEIYRVQILEVTLPGGTKREAQYGKHPYWLESRTWTFIPSGRLELKVTGFDKWDGAKFRDAKSTKLEARVSEVFDLISTTDAKRIALNVKHEATRLEYEKSSALRRVSAKLDSKVLGATAAWSRAEDIRKFAEALAVIEPNAEWIDRCRAVADVVDPLCSAASVPANLLPPEKDLDAWLPKIK